MEILILILLFFILYPLLKIAFTVWRQVRTIKKQFGQFGEQFGNGRGSSRSTASGGNYRKSQYNKERRGNRDGRRFPSNVGEYVDFEEIIEERVSPTPPYDPSAPFEPLISDANFEEIK